METITLATPRNLSRSDVESILQQWAAVQGACVTPRGRLARRYKTEGASMHWHIAGHRIGMGTVEVTYNPDTWKLDVSVHDNRPGGWATTPYRDLGKTLSKRSKTR
ncbi:hypothetical protein E6H29_07475 [Candidatus Bathyarchaeota archaeon]|nr:MAG: hypothetical protein E6H29_07475 [Candidatus Bathyarchaeota archaeon]